MGLMWRGNRTARRIGIAALLVMAPVWLSACGAKEDARTAVDSAWSASMVLLPDEGASPTAAAGSPGQESAGQAPEAGQASASPPALPAAEQGAARTVTFAGADGAEVTLPLIGVPTDYGVDMGGGPPSLLPAAELAAQAVVVPADQAGELALFWMNLGYEDRGFMMLAPKGWSVRGSVGANGSFGMHAEHPSDAGQFLDTIDTAGGCQGCAIANIGAYFPDLAKWAEEQGFTPDRPMDYLKTRDIGERMIEFEQSHEPAADGYGVLGAAYEEHEGGALFRTARTGYAQDGRALAETMIAYYEWMYADK
ncbi:DUF4850 domain-containing protein [Cohnella sp. 56]|uniref:DUF4850 domain-containing protein n=1 Tax=Cohnella sp. 56 TaxID=3113722 RepID=UPI0030E98053